MYLKVIAMVIPRQHKVEHRNPLSGLSDEELAAMVAHLEERIAQQRADDQTKLIEGTAVETNDPMVGVRLPVATIKKLGKMAEALGCDRPTAIRWLLDEAFSRGRAPMLLRSVRRQSEKSRGRLADEIADATIGNFRAKTVAKHAAARAGPPADKLKAEINALRVQQAAAARLSALGDRVALKQ